MSRTSHPLNCGTMFRFSFVANAAPGTINASLNIAETGVPQSLDMALIGPAGSDVIFADSFD